MSKPMLVGDTLSQLMQHSPRTRVQEILYRAGWTPSQIRMISPEHELNPLERYYHALLGRPHQSAPSYDYAEYLRYWRVRAHDYLAAHRLVDYAPGWSITKVIKAIEDNAVLTYVMHGIKARAEQQELFPNLVSAHS